MTLLDGSSFQANCCSLDTTSHGVQKIEQYRSSRRLLYGSMTSNEHHWVIPTCSVQLFPHLLTAHKGTPSSSNRLSFCRQYRDPVKHHLTHLHTRHQPVHCYSARLMYCSEAAVHCHQLSLVNRCQAGGTYCKHCGATDRRLTAAVVEYLTTICPVRAVRRWTTLAGNALDNTYVL